MALTPGGRLGPFEVTGSIGAGGMGEVYRARDTRLNRDVAIKVLPEAMDPAGGIVGVGLAVMVMGLGVGRTFFGQGASGWCRAISRSRSRETVSG